MLRPRKGQIVDGGRKSALFNLPPVGCPQGEPTSPAMFNLAIDSLRQVFQKMGDHRSQVACFADDISWVINGESEEEVIEVGEKAIKLVEEHLKLLGLDCAASKSAGLLISKSGCEFKNKHDHLNVHSGKVPIVKSTTLLGYQFMDNFSNDNFINGMKGKLMVQQNQIINLLNINSKGQLLKIAQALHHGVCLLYTSPSPRDGLLSRMPSSA